MYITSKQLDSLQHAIDFIGSNSNGADDSELYDKLQSDLTAIWKKGIKEFAKRKVYNKYKKAKLKVNNY